MSRLGIDRITGLIYEGRGSPTYPAWPTPIVTQVTLIESPDDFLKIPRSMDEDPFGWIFLEDSYDAVGRIRRGRLFQKISGKNWEETMVEPHPARLSDRSHPISSIHVQTLKELNVYIECNDILMKSKRGEGLQLAVGVQRAHSVWRILQTECTVNLDIFVTLRAESSYGILPDLDLTKIIPTNVPIVSSAIERVLNAAYRELPTSVVDQCRNAATVLVSRWMQQELDADKPMEKDLGSWLTTIREHFKERPKRALCAAIEIINLLHPRGKDNELMRMRLRTVTESDAEISVHSVGFLIREIGWAQ